MIFLPTLLKAIGGGLGVAGMLQGANANDFATGLNYRIDLANAGAERDNSRAGLRLQAAGDRITFDSARANFQLAQLDAEAGMRNAERLRLFAEATTKQGREAIRRQVRSFDEFQGTQRAAVAASGVEMSGSALEVMAESEARFRTQVEDMADEIGFARQSTLDEAALQEFGARNTMIGARAELSFAQRGRRLARVGRRIGRTAIRSQYQSNLLSAEMSLLSGADESAGTRAQAFETLLTGTGGFLTDRYQVKQLGMK